MVGTACCASALDASTQRGGLHGGPTPSLFTGLEVNVLAPEMLRLKRQEGAQPRRAPAACANGVPCANGAAHQAPHMAEHVASFFVAGREVKGLGRALDVWSLGYLLFYVFTGAPIAPVPRIG